jgi:hypothetical protein
MNSAKLEEAKKEYKKERKKYTDSLRMKRLKQQNNDFEPDSFTEGLLLSLQPMTDAKAFQLDVNQTFPDREILVMHVAKEANLCRINFICSLSDLQDIECTGPRFKVISHQSKGRGWHVSTSCICKGDKFFGIDDKGNLFILY